MNIFEKLRAGEYKTTVPLDEVELKVLAALVDQKDGERIQVKSNKQIGLDIGVSRNQVTKARRRLADKVDIIDKGF